LISKTGKIIIGILIVFIAVFWLTDPKRKHTAPPQPKAPDAIAQQAAELGIQPPVAPAAQPATPQLAASALPTPDFELLQERYGRSDPFAPIYEPPKKASAPVFTEDLPFLAPVAPVVFNPPSFKLTAISVSGGKGMAIIDGELLRVGDRIKEFTVTGIKPDQVTLRSDLGDKIYLKLRQEIKTAYDVSGNSISNIDVKKQEPEAVVVPSEKRQRMAPLPLPEYTLPSPDDIQIETPPPGSLP